MSKPTTPTTMHPSAGAILDSILGKGADPTIRRQLEQLATTPEARAALDRVDAEAQAHRAALVRELDGLDRKFAADVKRVTAARLAAEARLTAAVAEHSAARDAWAIATSASAGLSVRIGSERARLEAELVNSADPRLAELDRHVAQLQDASRHLVASVSWIEGRSVFGAPIHKSSSNLTEVTAARDELAAVRAEVARLQREPATRDVVTTELAGLVLRVQAAMQPFELDHLRLDEVTGALVFDAPGRHVAVGVSRTITNPADDGAED